MIHESHSRTYFKKMKILTSGQKGPKMSMKVASQKAVSESLKVQMFLSLQKEHLEVLQEKARNQGLEDSGSVVDLARRLANSSGTVQIMDAPQAFALKSKGDEEAAEFIRKANARILPQVNGKVVRGSMKTRSFQFLDKNGVEYSAECPFVPLRNETALMILTKGWVYTLENQRALLTAMRKDITHYSCHLIRKKTSGDGRFYLMLHTKKKTS